MSQLMPWSLWTSGWLRRRRCSPEWWMTPGKWSLRRTGVNSLLDNGGRQSWCLSLFLLKKFIFRSIMIWLFLKYSPLKKDDTESVTTVSEPLDFSDTLDSQDDRVTSSRDDLGNNSEEDHPVKDVQFIRASSLKSFRNQLNGYHPNMNAERRSSARMARLSPRTASPHSFYKDEVRPHLLKMKLWLFTTSIFIKDFSTNPSFKSWLCIKILLATKWWNAKMVIISVKNNFLSRQPRFVQNQKGKRQRIRIYRQQDFHGGEILWSWWQSTSVKVNKKSIT